MTLATPRIRFLAALLLLLLLPLVTACSKGPGSKPRQTPGPATLAVVGEELIEKEDLERRVTIYSPQLQQAYAQQEAMRRRLLEEMIEEELIFAVAQERGLDRDPRIQRLFRQQLQTMVKEDVLGMVKLDAITEPETEAYYRQHAEEFRSPLFLQASHILLAGRKEADALFPRAQAAAASEAAFAALARQHSLDTDTRGNGGDLGIFSQPGGRIPEAVFSAARALQKPGEISGPVESAKGFHLVRLRSRSGGELRPLPEVRLQARIAAYRAKREATYQRFLRELAAKWPVQRFADRLESVEIKAP